MNLIRGAAFLLLATAISCAQDTPKADIAVEYSHLQILKGYTISMNGASGSVAFNANRWFGVAGDFGVYHGYPGQSLTGETYTLGPRFTYRHFDRVTPFVHALFGGSHFSANSGGITGGGNQFAFGIGGGADLALHRAARLALRPQFEYFGIRSQGSTTDSVRLSVGIVYRFGIK